ncbi:hypothetical protein COLO4_06073 [Corchorus olitorius]|uniref:Uncharacterized protein n=1 Tax=Corchorus olitorius TaxID=93759 RepID=A0A1R3KP12_9ROSI|nr:hypothetical protein COLO4_06073 [Corchorus olitorius]
MAVFKAIDSEPTLRRSRREVKKTPLWGLWKDEEDQTLMEDSDSDSKGIDFYGLYFLAEICCGFPETNMISTTRPRSRLERKKNPLWGSKDREEKLGLNKRKHLSQEEEDEEPKKKACLNHAKILIFFWAMASANQKSRVVLRFFLVMIH